jgi:hypothetical protein
LDTPLIGFARRYGQPDHHPTWNFTWMRAAPATIGGMPRSSNQTR